MSKLCVRGVKVGGTLDGVSVGERTQYEGNYLHLVNDGHSESGDAVIRLVDDAGLMAEFSDDGLEIALNGWPTVMPAAPGGETTSGEGATAEHSMPFQGRGVDPQPDGTL